MLNVSLPCPDNLTPPHVLIYINQNVVSCGQSRQGHTERASRQCPSVIQGAPEKFETSDLTVAKRMRKVEKQGIIKGYSATLNHEKFGYGMTTVTEVTVSKGKLVEVQNEIARMRPVCVVYDVTGG